MSAEINTLRRKRPSPAAAQSAPASRPQHAELLFVDGDGSLRVRFGDGSEAMCDWLLGGGSASPVLQPGDRVLVLSASDEHRGVVLGRIGRYTHPEVSASPPNTLSLEARERVSLRCGQASIELREDGKVFIRGEDVLVRAKGTKRIRAGTVSIN